MSEKIASRLYVIVNKCENLPDLRTEKEKKRKHIPKWQVIFPDAKEELTTGLLEGLSEVCWMTECFLTLKLSSNSFSMIVLDDNSRKAGKITVDLKTIPVANNKILKPGRESEGAREAYRNLQEPHTQCLDDKNTVLSYWIWALDFRENRKSISNLEKLKFLSKSAFNVTKETFQKNVNIDQHDSGNPFQSDMDNFVAAKSSNPFGDDFELADKFGNSTFANTEQPKFRPSIWIPVVVEGKNTNPFLGRERASSLPGIDEISKNFTFKVYSDNIEKHKQDNNREESPCRLSQSDLDQFKTLSDLYEAKPTKSKYAELKKATDEQFFALLNNIQRQFALNVVQIKSLEANIEKQNGDLCELRKTIYTLKTKILNNNLEHILLV